MSKSKILASLVLPLLLASFLQSQSLAELAKKEKERRAALKGKATTVVTSAEIAKVKKRPAVEAAEAQAAGEGEAATGEAAAQAQQEAAPPAAGQAAAAAVPEKPAPAEPTAAEMAAKDQAERQKKQQELADRAQEKLEMVELLNLKLNALYQEFQGLDNIKSREMIQLQISDTYDKLLKAEAESAKAQKELEDFMAQAAKGTTPKIWIR